MMKILLYDIETAPNLAFVWGMYEQNVIEFKSEWYILSFSAKWLGRSEVMTRALPDYPGYEKDKENDLLLLKDLWELMSEADVIVGHNSDAFDNKKVNTRFIELGFSPPEPYRTVDTRKIAKKHFAFNSNKLDDLGRRLGVGRKIKTGGFELWRGCLDGDEKSWAKMKKYNRQDVLLLEKVYLKLRPWGGHPNIAALAEADVCGRCGSDHLNKRGRGVTLKGVYQIWRCMKCGGSVKGPVGKTTELSVL
jgi:hypothetical protein